MLDFPPPCLITRYIRMFLLEIWSKLGQENQGLVLIRTRGRLGPSEVNDFALRADQV